MKTRLILFCSIFISFSLFLAELQAKDFIELRVVKNYNSILLKCSDWADSSKVSGDIYRDSCVVTEWQDLIRGRVLRAINKEKASQSFGLSSLEEEIFIELSDWRAAHDGCQGLGDELTDCMDYQAHLITKAIIGEIEQLRKNISGGTAIVKAIKDNPVKDCIKKNGSCSSCHCSEILSYDSDYAGYPLCSKVLGSAGELYRLVLESLIEGDFLKEGEAYFEDIYDLGKDLFQGMQFEGWTIESVTKFPTGIIRAQNNMFSDKPGQPSSSGGCFEGSTEITRLSLDSGLFGWSSRGANKEDFENKSANSFYSEPVDIKDIKKGDYILSSTVASVLSEHLHKTCWAEVGSTNKTTMGEWKYEGFKEIEYVDRDGQNKKIKVTPKHRFYAYRYDQNDGNYSWMEAGDPLFNNPSTHVYSRGFVDDDLNPSNTLALDVIKVIDVKSDSGTEIYNLTIPDTFTYFVGGGLLSHNLKISL